MSLLVWLPLNGNVKNQGLSNITFSNSDTSTIVSDVGKITANCYKRTSKTTNGLIKSTSTINLNNDFSMACWAYVIECVGDTANGLVSCHSHTDNTGCGITVKQVSTSDYRISCNTGTGSSRTYNTYYGTTNIKNKWCHLALTYNKTSKTLCLYVNGVNEYTLENYTNASKSDYILLLDWSTTYSANTYKPAAKLNDVRIYDHCLSVKEIKELSKGLALHYKLSRGGENLLTSTFTANPSGFNDYAGKATASRLESDGYTIGKIYALTIPTYTETFSNYNIYLTLPRDTSKAVNKDGKTYTLSFKMKASKALSSYKMYYEFNNTSKTFDIGTSWKTFSITGSATSQYSAFYVVYGKENRDKIAGGTLYIADLKLEFGSKATSWIPNKSEDIYTKLGFNNLIEPDCSGYGNNGTITGSLIYSNETPRYEGSIGMDGTGNMYLSKIPDLIKSTTTEFTMSFWFKTTSISLTSCLWNGRTTAGTAFAIFLINNTLRVDDSNQTTVTANLEANKWYHVCVTWKSGGKKITYINGIEKSNVAVGTLSKSNVYATIGRSSAADSVTASNYLNGNISDFRIYATELSAADIKALYDTPISIDNNHNLHCMEVVE